MEGCYLIQFVETMQYVKYTCHDPQPQGVGQQINRQACK